MPLVAGRRAEVLPAELPQEWVRRRVAERCRTAFEGQGFGVGVVDGSGEALPHLLAIADVESVIIRTPDGLLIRDPAKLRHASSVECGREGSRSSSSSEVLNRIDVDSLVVMQTAGLYEVDFDDREVVRRILESRVDLLRVRVAIAGIHDAARRSWRQIVACWRDHRSWIDPIPVVGQGNVRARHGLGRATRGVVRAVATDTEGIREYSVVCLLDHEQRDVLERLAEVESVPAVQNETAIA